MRMHFFALHLTSLFSARIQSTCLRNVSCKYYRRARRAFLSLHIDRNLENWSLVFQYMTVIQIDHRKAGATKFNVRHFLSAVFPNLAIWSILFWLEHNADENKSLCWYQNCTTYLKVMVRKYDKPLLCCRVVGGHEISKPVLEPCNVDDTLYYL